MSVFFMTSEKPSPTGAVPIVSMSGFFMAIEKLSPMGVVGIVSKKGVDVFSSAMSRTSSEARRSEALNQPSSPMPRPSRENLAR